MWMHFARLALGERMESGTVIDRLQLRRVRILRHIQVCRGNIGTGCDVERIRVEHRGGDLGGASAALGIINRRGFCKHRHIDAGRPCIQRTAAELRRRFAKVLGRVNPAGLHNAFGCSHKRSPCTRLAICKGNPES